MTYSLSRIAPVLPLLLSSALFTSDTGKELARLSPPQAAVQKDFEFAPLEYDPVASTCSADTQLTLRPVPDDSGLSSQLTCAAVPEREVVSSYSCVPYSWGWKCFYADMYCYFFYTGGVYCYSYADQGGW